MTIQINGTSGISGVDGSAGTPAIQGTDTNTGLTFGTDTVGIVTGGTTRATVDSSGRLGIGTASPGSTLDVNGAINASSSVTTPSTTISYSGTAVPDGANNSALYSATGNIGLAGQYASLNFVTTNGAPTTTAWWMLGRSDGANDQFSLRVRRGQTSGSDQMAYSVVTTGVDSAKIIDSHRWFTNGTERARLTSSGQWLVGTSSTSGFVTDGGKFYLRNSGECMAIYNDTGTGWNMRHNATSNGGTFYFISFAAAGTGVGGITSNSTTTTYGTTSDYRLKENIEPITDSVDRLKQLNPCKFNFIAAPERTVDGFLAHEVQTHVPESVVGEKDAVDQSGEPVYQNIDQSKLVPLLTAALQEALAKIETLETRLTALEGGINS